MLALMLAVAAASFFRLYHLGVPSFRADTLIFSQYCRQAESAWFIFTHWTVLGHFPLPLAMTKMFVDLVPGPVTDFLIRFPNALCGILTVLCVYLIGRQMSGRWFGVVLAWWLAVNPFHIQLSREAYFYSSLLLGVAAQVWACLWVYRHRNRPVPFPPWFHLAAFAGFLLMVYSHFSGWWIGVFIVLFTGGVLFRRMRRFPGGRRDFWVWLAGVGCIGLPLLFVPWGLPHFIHLLEPEVKADAVRSMGGIEAPFLPFIWRMVTSAAWGATPLRVAVLVFAVVAAALALVLRWARARRAWIVLFILLGGFAVYCMSLFTGGAYYAQRHAAYLLPLYLAILCYGIWRPGAFPLARRACPSAALRRTLAWAAAGLVVAINLRPAWASTQLTGKPTPFKAVAEWCDRNLPRHTLVLVERWFDPWNELSVHNSTNVYFTFTVPSEPRDVFERFNWPATAREFFVRFPDAAFIEYNNSERERTGVVPNVHFARSVSFTNRAGIELARYGVAYRDEFYDPHTNRLVTTIFYNNRDDVLARSRQEGKRTVALFGPEWGYAKLWQQLRDFRDWRILEKEAALDVCNLTATTNRATLKIRGMAVNGSKRVTARAGAVPLGARDFRHFQLEEWRLENIDLQPGLNRVVFSDPVWYGAGVPFLVDRVEVSTP